MSQGQDYKLYSCTKCCGKYILDELDTHLCEPSREKFLAEREARLDEVYDASEQDEVLRIFTEMLRSVTADGGRKRAKGTKPSWKVDPSHLAAVFSHINKVFHGETVDPDSGVSPWVHAGWRCLALGWQQMNEKK